MSEEMEVVREERPSDYFFQLHEVVLDDPDLNLNAIVVYTVLAGIGRKSRQVWASNATLAERCRMSVRTLQEALRTLEKNKLIKTAYPSSTKRLISIPHIDSVYSYDTDENDPELHANPAPLHAESAPTHAAPAPQYTNEQDNVTDDKTSSSTPAPVVAEKPWDLWVAYGTANEVDLTLATEGQKKIALRDAKLLLKDGVTATEVAQCTRYLRSQTWRKDPVKFQTVVREIGDWRMNGRPSEEASRTTSRSVGAFDAFAQSKRMGTPTASPNTGAQRSPSTASEPLEAEVRSIR